MNTMLPSCQSAAWPDRTIGPLPNRSIVGLRRERFENAQ